MNDMLEQLPPTYAESPLLYWVLGSVLAYALATNALWLARTGKLSLPTWSEGLIHVARFAFYLGVPYLALGGWPLPPFSALLSPQDMGLVGIGGRWPPTRWLSAVGTSVGFGLASFLLLLLAWMSANRARPGARLRFPPRPWWLITIDVLYLEVHWAFYRAALTVELDDVYIGVFLGLALVFLEWALNPFWRSGWRAENQPARQWLHVAMALVMAILFLFTRNLWVCLGVHLALEPAFWALGSERAPEEGSTRNQSGDAMPEAVEAVERPEP
jgi:hypothetical protein